MNPSTFTTGTATRVPCSVLADTCPRTRRITSTPTTSSPWMAALTQTTGPGSRPCTTWTGMLTSPPVTRRVSGSSTDLLAPARTRTPPMANDSRAIRTPPVRPTHGPAGATAAVGGRDVDDVPLLEDLASDQQAEAHLVATRQRHLGGHHPVEEPQVEPDDDTVLGVTRRAPDRTPVEHRHLDHDRVLGAALPRVHLEAGPPLAVALELLEGERVQRRRTRAGVDLGLHPLDADTRKADPLTPADRTG